jgi:hypothetical protein
MLVNDDVDEHPRSSPLWQSVHSGGLLTGDLGAAKASHLRHGKETLLSASIKRVERKEGLQQRRQNMTKSRMRASGRSRRNALWCGRRLAIHLA